MKIETERLIIRNFVFGDVAALFEVLSNKDVMEYVEKPYTYERTQKLVEEAAFSQSPLIYALQIKDTGELIGHVIYHPYGNDVCYEIGWIIAKKWWGKGFAGEVTKSLIYEAQKEGIKCLVIECDPRQEATKRIAVKNGFMYEGKTNGLDVYKLEL